MNARDIAPRPFLGRWVRATAAGWALGVPFVVLFALVAEGLGVSSSQAPVGAGMGLGVGLLQARALRGRIRRPSAWFCACFFGLTVPFLVADLAWIPGPTLHFSLYAAVVVGGLIVGTWQAFLLRAVSRHAGWWIGASALGWTLASGAAALADDLPKSPSFTGLPAALLYLGLVGSGGVLLGLLTGLLLVRLLPEASGR